MFIKKIQNSKIVNFISDSFIFDNIDLIAFVFLILTLFSTAFAASGTIGITALGFIFCIIFKFLFKQSSDFKLSIINKTLIIYLLFVFISLMGSSYFFLSLFGTAKIIIYISFYFTLTFYLFENKDKILFIVLLIALLTSFEAVVGILQNLSHVEAIATWQDTSNLTSSSQIISRAYGTLKPYNPNLLAGYLLTGLSCLFASLGFCFIEKKQKGTVFFALLFLTVCYSILPTGCRGAYLGLFAFFSTIIIFAFLQFKKYAIWFTGFLGICFAGVCCMPAFLNRILSIFSLRGDSSISFRMNVYKACFDMFMDNKFLGIGVGNKNFREIYGLYMKTGYDALGAYSVPLEIAVESGIFALLAFGCYIVLSIIKCVKFLSDEKKSHRAKILIFMVLLTIISTMFHGFFDTIFFRPQIQIIFWVNMAIFNTLIQKQ